MGHKVSILLLSSTILAACGHQPPAPVVSGVMHQSAYKSAPSRTSPVVSEDSFTSRVSQRNSSDLPPMRLADKEQFTAQDIDMYVVKRGDTLSEIASKHNMAVSTLVGLNDLPRSHTIYPGQKLRLNDNVDELEKQDENAGEVSYITYRVKRGENLFRIGLKHDISALDLMAANNFDKPQDLIAGTTIRIPVNQIAATRSEGAVAQINEQIAKAKGFGWPAKGPILESFGKKTEGVTNTSIKIAVDEGEPIYAADAGTVIYASNGLKSYGNLVLLRHQNGLITAYAHSSELKVNRNQKVAKGQLIAFAGQTGNAERPMLRFEVRRNARAIDPIGVLPKRD